MIGVLVKKIIYVIQVSAIVNIIRHVKLVNNSILKTVHTKDISLVN